MDSTQSNAGKSESSYNRISPTAWGVAFSRRLSDIPFASEIFHQLQEIMRRTRSAAEVQELEQLVRLELTPIFEARFKLVNRVLKEYRARQILEIAAGFSPRSMDLARDPSIEYVEFDLPALMRDKRAIVEELIRESKIPRYPNVHWSAGNALVMKDLLAAVQPFRDEPIAVANEGLLRYLTFEGKAAVARNIRRLLERFGGVWITPDVSVRPEHAFGLSAENLREQSTRIERLTGIEIAKNYFENENTAREFFEKLGFLVESRSFMEVADELVSPQRLNLSPEQVATGLGRHSVFVMTLRHESS